MKQLILKDAGAERALLGSILKYGKDTFIEADSFISPSDFSLGLNRSIYTCFKNLSEDPSCEGFDVESLKLKMKVLGFGEYLTSKNNLEYLDLLPEVNFDMKNIKMFAYQVKKYSVLRELHSRYSDATNYIENLTGTESLSEVISNAESKVTDVLLTNDNGQLEKITKDVEIYIQELLNKDIVDQIGLPTGYPLWDSAIGGGLRKSTVNVVGARAGVAKSFFGMNVAINIVSRGIPVLLLDTELTKDPQRSRMMCIRSQCPLHIYETRQFKQDKELVNRITEVSKEMKNWPFYYESIAGLTHIEAIALMRRWIVKYVGFNNQGKANDCLIIYDYMKLCNGNDLSKYSPEYLLLGLLATDLHNFAVKYEVPILSFTQLNREGIDSDETNVVAGSDRILWLASTLSLLKDKDENDIGLGCNYSYGNKKMMILKSRYGPGLEKFGDYINLKCSLKPGVSKYQACGLITEGFLLSEISHV